MCHYEYDVSCYVEMEKRERGAKMKVGKEQWIEENGEGMLRGE